MQHIPDNNRELRQKTVGFGRKNIRLFLDRNVELVARYLQAECRGIDAMYCEESRISIRQR